MNTNTINTSFIDELMTSKARVTLAKEAFKQEVLKQAKILVNEKKLPKIQQYTQEVLELIANELDINVFALTTKCRNRPLSDARKIYAYIIRKVATIEVSLEKTGEVIGRDHATVLVQVKEAEKLMTNKSFSEKMNRCLDAFHKKYTTADFNFIPQY